MALNIGAIPDELKVRPQWVVHRSKVPYNVRPELIRAGGPTSSRRLLTPKRGRHSTRP
jgi:hypothetical protein